MCTLYSHCRGLAIRADCLNGDALSSLFDILLQAPRVLPEGIKKCLTQVASVFGTISHKPYVYVSIPKADIFTPLNDILFAGLHIVHNYIIR